MTAVVASYSIGPGPRPLWQLVRKNSKSHESKQNNTPAFSLASESDTEFSAVARLLNQMRSLFPQYYGSDVTIDLTIKNTLIVFDSSVLLNLYRYPTDASQDLLMVMEKLVGQTWIPNQVAFEYHSNRLGVISEQKQRFRETRDLVEKTVKSLETEISKLQLKKRHSTIDPSSLLSTVQGAAETIIRELSEQESNHLDVTDADSILDRLTTLIGSNVGSPPTDQEWIHKLENEGKSRYENCIPPGYCDRSKDDDRACLPGGLTYSRRYGDLLLWKQLICHCSDVKTTQLVLVIDDEKEDWWQIIGSKRIGPRPELRDEIMRSTSVQSFAMMSSERFAKTFSELLNIDLRATTITELEDAKSAADLSFKEAADRRIATVEARVSKVSDLVRAALAVGITQALAENLIYEVQVAHSYVQKELINDPFGPQSEEEGHAAERLHAKLGQLHHEIKDCPKSPS